MEDYFKFLWPFQKCPDSQFPAYFSSNQPICKNWREQRRFPGRPRAQTPFGSRNFFVAIIFPSKRSGTHCSSGGAGGGSGGSSYYRRALQAGRLATPRPGVLFVDTILESSWQSLGSLSSGDFGSNPG